MGLLYLFYFSSHFPFQLLEVVPLEIRKTDHGPQYDLWRGLLGCEYESQRLEMYRAYVNNTGVVITALIGIFRALLNESNVSIGTCLMLISAQHVESWLTSIADGLHGMNYEAVNTVVFFQLNSHVVNVLKTLRRGIPIYVEQDATLHSLFIFRNCSTCFGCYFHPSSGAHTTVSTASGICHTVTATYRRAVPTPPR